MAFEYKAIRRVEFSETDMAGIMHYSNFFRFMETAEHGLLRSLGHSAVMRDFDPPMGWPRVHAECDYRAPLRFEDKVEIHILVEKIKRRSIRYLFKFTKIEARKRTEVARGNVVVACVVLNADGSFSAAPIPGEFLKKISAAPRSLLA